MTMKVLLSLSKIIADILRNRIVIGMLLISRKRPPPFLSMLLADYIHVHNLDSKIWIQDKEGGH